MRTTLLIILLCFTAITACDEDGTQNCVCPEIYAPVCGSDNVTYSNDCFARCAGILEYSEGECP